MGKLESLQIQRDDVASYAGRLSCAVKLRASRKALRKVSLAFLLEHLFLLRGIDRSRESDRFQSERKGRSIACGCYKWWTEEDDGQAQQPCKGWKDKVQGCQAAHEGEKKAHQTSGRQEVEENSKESRGETIRKARNPEQTCDPAEARTDCSG